MKPLVQTPEEEAKLLAVADSWCGTPWVAEGAVRGTGASCSCAPFAILAECGHTAPTPPLRRGLLKVQILPKMLEWLDGHPEFYSPINLTEIRAGDVLLFDAGIGHLGLALSENRMVHSWQKGGVHKTFFRDARFEEKLLRAWRPILNLNPNPTNGQRAHQSDSAGQYDGPVCG